MCTEGERPYVASSYAYQVHIYPDKRGVDMRLQCANVHRRERPYAYQMGKKTWLQYASWVKRATAY